MIYGITNAINFINYGILVLFIQKIVHTKPKKSKLILATGLLGLIWILFEIIFINSYSEIVILINLIIILKINFNINISTQVIILGLIVFCHFPFINILYKICEINNIIINKLYFNISIFLMLGIMYLIISKLNLNIEALNFSLKNKKNIRFVIFGLLIFYLQIILVSELNTKALFKLIILNYVSLPPLFYIIVKNIVNSWVIENANLKINNLKNFNKSILETNNDLRVFKHDFNNIMVSINGYIKTRDFKSLKCYFNKLLINNCEKETICLNPALISDPAIYSIIVNKYHLSKKHNIKMDIEALLNFEFIHENVYDISRILGILLDNAIEAARDSLNKSISLGFYERGPGTFWIVITNSYSNPKMDIEKLFNKHYTTKKNTINQGLGLWEIKRIISNNESLDLHTIIEENIFTQKLEITVLSKQLEKVPYF